MEEPDSPPGVGNTTQRAFVQKADVSTSTGVQAEREGERSAAARSWENNAGRGEKRTSMVEPLLSALFGGQKVHDHPKGLPCAKCWGLQSTKIQSTPCPPPRLGAAAPGPLSDGLGCPRPVTWLQHRAVCQPEKDGAANGAQKALGTSPSSPHAQVGFGKLWLSLASPQLAAGVLSRHRAGDAAQDQTQRVALPGGDEGTSPRTHQTRSSPWAHRGTGGFQLQRQPGSHHGADPPSPSTSPELHSVWDFPGTF